MRSLFTFVLFLASAITCLASPVTISFLTPPGQTAGGYYVGYTAAEVTSGVQTVSFDLMCDDFVHRTSVPSGPFTYNMTTLADISPTRWVNLPNYQIAAILLFDYDGLDPLTQSAQAGDYNFAIWNLFNPSETPDYGNSLALIASATTVVQNGGNVEAYKNFRIFTPTGNAISNQEFIGLTTVPFNESQVPEPTSAVLLGGGCAALYWMRRRRS